jgi:hypothetical protein
MISDEGFSWLGRARNQDRASADHNGAAVAERDGQIFAFSNATKP